jgi:pheromone shutdown protein TraB
MASTPRRLLCALLPSGRADQLGVEPGAEFRAAAEAAAAVAGGGCCLVLGDRPIEITLQRAWDALTWPRRLQLLRDLLGAAGALAPASEVRGREQRRLCLCMCRRGSCWRARRRHTPPAGVPALPAPPLNAMQGRAAAWGSAPLTQSQVEALRSDDAVSALFAAMSARYPELVPPLVHERDMYLAWSLNRSKAVAGARAVVGCIGKGHHRGVVYALRSDPGQLRFRDLVGGKNSKRGRRAAAAAAAQRLAVELLVGTALWAAWVAWSSAPQLQQ